MRALLRRLAQLSPERIGRAIEDGAGPALARLTDRLLTPPPQPPPAPPGVLHKPPRKP